MVRHILKLFLVLSFSVSVSAQVPVITEVEKEQVGVYIEDDDVEVSEDDPIILLNLLTDSVPGNYRAKEEPVVRPFNFLPVGQLPDIAFMPVVFDGLVDIDTMRIDNPEPFLHNDISAFDWLTSTGRQMRQYRRIKQEYMLRNMDYVKLNVNTLPKPPTKYRPEVDPSKVQLAYTQVIVDKSAATTNAGPLDV